MVRTISHFMWGYQPHFRSALGHLAKRIFAELDSRLEPSVFLVGILGNDTEERWPACVEPETEFWIQSDAFDGALADAQRIKVGYPEAQMLHSHPLAQQREDAALRNRALRDAIKQIVDRHPTKPADTTYHVALPANVGGYQVAAVLGLRSSVASRYGSLKTSSAKIHDFRSVELTVSLIEATARELLRYATEELRKAEPGFAGTDVATETLLRAAADEFMKGVVWRVDQDRIEGINELFRACTSISSLYYERSVSKGQIVLARRDHSALRQVIEFVAPTALREHRAARKLAQLTSSTLALHSDSEQVFGLVEVGTYTPTQEDLFEIHFLDHHHWELRHSGQALMLVKYGVPCLPKRSFDVDKLRVDLPRIFNGVTGPDADNLVLLVEAAEKATHGTLLIISDAAEVEAKRLSRQGTPIAPHRATPDLLIQLTPIDGAILLSPAGLCYGIGTILDGQATENGDPGRGARFNSAVRYIETSLAAGVRCMAVVVSEDRGVDLIPNLKQAISRSNIDSAIAECQSASESESVNATRYRSARRWLDEHRFYLTRNDCDLLNPLVKVIEERVREQEKSNLWIVLPEFTPHPEFDEALYYLAG